MDLTPGEEIAELSYKRWWITPNRDAYTGNMMREIGREAYAAGLRAGREDAAREEAVTHVYLSTGCRHGEHDYCQSMTGLQGKKRPGRCKFCDARCVCGCHKEQAINLGRSVRGDVQDNPEERR